MNLTEARSVINLSSPKSKLLQIECLQLVAFFLLFVLLTTRSLRRRYNSKTLEKISAPASATSVTYEVRRTCLLRSISKCLEGNTPPSDDATLLRCSYLVDPNIRRLSAGKMDDPGMTVGKIWSCEDGSLLSSSTGRKNELKNTCLAFSLFWMLLQNFAGIPSYESSQPEAALKFVQDGLLLNRSPLEVIEIIEIELAFLGDLFFGKYFYAFYHFGWTLLLVRQFLLFGAVGLPVISVVVDYIITKDLGLTPGIQGQHMDVIVTGIAIILIALLQLGQAIVLFNSRWAKVRLICLYVRRESWKKKTILDRCINRVARIICPVRYQLFKPWQRKLGQYSLLMQSRKSMRSHGLFQRLTGIRLGRPGRKESEAKFLSEEIQMIVILTLKDRGHDLTNGMRSLEKSSLSEETKRKLILECKPSSKLDTDARVVLVWHIATSVCEINPKLTSSTAQCANFRVATTLSKYCAYLVAFAPDLLPGKAAATTFTCSDAIDEAYESLKDCGSSNRYEKLKEIANGDRDELEASQRILDTSIVRQGAVLGKVLEMEIGEACQRWKVLADFWAEMILYLAPNATNQWDHVEKLEDGGEFITHLWALLYHAGIVDRDSFHKSESGAEAETRDTATIAVLGTQLMEVQHSTSD